MVMTLPCNNCKARIPVDDLLMPILQDSFTPCLCCGEVVPDESGRYRNKLVTVDMSFRCVYCNEQHNLNMRPPMQKRFFP